jgi:hypothetical protein
VRVRHENVGWLKTSQAAPGSPTTAPSAPYLGLLTAAQGDHTAAAGHLDAATARRLRLGAARWAEA